MERDIDSTSVRQNNDEIKMARTHKMAETEEIQMAEITTGIAEETTETEHGVLEKKVKGMMKMNILFICI